MKLTDISATTGSRAATAKLSRQVSKVTVAAGKEPRTNLGVLGISIGQTQSTGTTSKVSEARATYIYGQDAYDLLIEWGHHSGHPFRAPTQGHNGEPVHFDQAAAMNECIAICHIWNSGDMRGSTLVLNALQQVEFQFDNVVFQEHLRKITAAAAVLKEHDLELDDSIAPALHWAEQLHDTHNGIVAHCKAVDALVGMVDDVWNVAHDAKNAEASFARAVLTKLGLSLEEKK